VVADAIVMFASTVLVLFSTFCFCAAVWREMVPEVKDPAPAARRIPSYVLYLINGSLVLVSLAALIGIWVIRYRGL
jgi:putative membrane protein